MPAARAQDGRSGVKGIGVLEQGWCLSAWHHIFTAETLGSTMDMI